VTLRCVALLFPASVCLSCGGPSSPENVLPAAPSDAGPALPLAAPPGAPDSGPALERLLGTLHKDRRQFEVRAPGVMGAYIPGVLTADLDARGLRAWSGDDTVALRTAAVSGRPYEAGAPRPGACTRTSEVVGSRCVPAAERVGEGVVERWTSSPTGVRQGWTVAAPPDPDVPELELRLTVDVGTLLRVDADGRGATLRGSTGAPWRYTDLVAWDADGTDLSARLVADGPHLLVRVDVSGARWPVTVDPLLGTGVLDEDQLVASDGYASASFGASVTSGLDLNGDGYDDLVVGAREQDAYGTVYVYYGTASGLDRSTEVVLSSPTAADADFGDSVASAGDVNGDGYDDLVVGARLDSSAAFEAGAAYLYPGAATGVSSSTATRLVASDGASFDAYSETVAGAGDLDGDGYDDVIVGAPIQDGGGANRGAAYVYFGSATGIAQATEVKLTASDGASDDFFGWSVARAGDLDGDGYDDVVVGAHNHDGVGTNSNSGAAYVCYGAATGISSSSEVKLTASDAAYFDRFGISAATADLDGDGYDDLVIGADLDDDGGASSGSAYVYYGAASGIQLSSEEKLTASDAAASARFGFSAVGLGDHDGDGYDDVMVGPTTTQTPVPPSSTSARRPACRAPPRSSSSLRRPRAARPSGSRSVDRPTSTATGSVHWWWGPKTTVPSARTAGRCTSTRPRAGQTSPRPTAAAAASSGGRRPLPGMWTATATMTLWWVPTATTTAAAGLVRPTCTTAPAGASTSPPKRSSPPRTVRQGTPTAGSSRLQAT
jgi:hypothetical protein